MYVTTASDFFSREPARVDTPARQGTPTMTINERMKATKTAVGDLFRTLTEGERKDRKPLADTDIDAALREGRAQRLAAERCAQPAPLNSPILYR